MSLFKKLFQREPDGPAAADASQDTPPEWAAFFKTRERYDRFDAALRSYFKNRGQRAIVVDGMLQVTAAPGSSQVVNADERSMGLGNIAQVCALQAEEAWPETIAKHFAIMERVLHADRDLATLTLDDVTDRLGIRFWDMSVEATRAESVWREDIPGLASVLCLDEPETIHSVRKDQISHWNSSTDELFERALSNLPTLAPVARHQHQMPEGHTLHEFLGESFFSCSWALRLSDWPDLDGPHGLFFAVPNRHRVMVMEFRGPKSILPLGQFMQIAYGLDQEGPGSISPRVYWKRSEQILEIPYLIKDGALQVTPPPEFIEYLNQVTD